MKYPVLLCFLFFSGLSGSMAQQWKFGFLRGNSGAIISTCFDRDSAMLFTYDKSGSVVVWDADNMTPIRRFNTVPENMWQNENYAAPGATMRVSNNRVFMMSKPAVYMAGKGVWDAYGRVSGRHYAQSDTNGGADQFALLKNNETVIAHNQRKPVYTQGKMVYSVLSKYAVDGAGLKDIYLTNPVTCLEVSPDQKYVALGYAYKAGMEVYDLNTFEKIFSTKADQAITTIRFIPGGVIYTGDIGGKVFIHRFSGSSTQQADLQNTMPTQIEVSPSGKYLAIYDTYKLAMYDLEKGDFISRDIAANVPTFTINAVNFLTEDILLLAGADYSTHDDIYPSSGPAEKAGLMKLNWRTLKSGTNLALDDLNRELFNFEMEAVGDSMISLYNRTTSYIHLLKPSALGNTFSSGGAVKNDASGSSVWYLDRANFSEYMRLIEARGEGGTDTVFAARIKNLQGADYNAVRVHSTAQLVVWADIRDVRNPIIIRDFKGKELYRYQTDLVNRSNFWFSPDGKWFAYKRKSEITKNTEIVVLATRDFLKPRVLATGNGFNTDRPVFNAASTRFCYRVSDHNSNKFTLMTLDLQSGKSDVLTSFDFIPLAYTVGADFTRLAVHIPFNLADTALLQNKARMQEAAKYSGRNIYHPVIMLLDLAADKMQIFSVAGKQRINKMILMPNALAALQDDGMIYHYNLTDTSRVMIQWLRGKEQSIAARNYYYSSPGNINRITQYTPAGYYPLGQQDRFFNQPHRILQDFESTRKELTGLYQKAFEKRLKQYTEKVPAASAPDVPVLTADRKLRQEFHTTDRELNFTIGISIGNPVEKLVVTVNDYSVYGREGLRPQGGQPQLAVKVPLDPGSNKVMIQAVDSKGQYSKPIRLDYFADYKLTSEKNKLWILSAGVSDYADTTFNLKYAAKDASDFVKVFSYKDNYDTVLVRTMLDKEVTAKGFLAELAKAGQLGRNDVVLVYLAGHGLLDNQANFYFATHDMDFSNPARNGLAYEELMRGLEKLPSRNKVLFLDACHSGLLDRSRYDYRPVTHGPNARIVSQSTRGTVGINTDKSAYPDEDVFMFMQKVFSDFSEDNHVNVLSASLGNSYALENDSLKNGLFTYSLIKAIGLAKAVPAVEGRKYAEGSFINLDHLKTYLNKQVRDLSDGRQIPTFSLSKTAGTIHFAESKISSLYIYDLDYKPLDPKDYKPSQAAQYRSFLDRYKN